MKEHKAETTKGKAGEKKAYKATDDEQRAEQRGEQKAQQLGNAKNPSENGDYPKTSIPKELPFDEFQRMAAEKLALNDDSNPDAPRWEHIVINIEEFLAGDDKHSVLSRSLFDRVEAGGFRSLNYCERIYFAVDRFEGTIVNGLLDHFWEAEDPALHEAVAEGFRLIDEPRQYKLYSDMLATWRSGNWQPMDHDQYMMNGEYDDRGDEFFNDDGLTEDKLDNWARSVGLPI